MEKLTCKSLDEKDKDTYERFCKENHASFLQSWDWGQWQKENGNEPVRVSIFEDAKLVCTAQLLKHTTPVGEYLYCPYGPIVSGKVKGENEKFLNAIITHLKETHANILFTRFEPTTPLEIQDSRFKIYETSHIQPGSTIISDLTKTEDQILASMHPKTRYGIRIAQKFGVIVRKLEPSEYTDSSKLFVDTLARRGLTVQNESFFKKIMSRKNWEQVSTNTFGAFKDGLLLATAFCVDYDDTRVYLYGGSCNTHKEKMPSYLLHWGIMKDAKTRGLKKYDWWGAENSKGEKPGFVTFKERFGGKKIEYGNAFDIVLHPLKYRTYKLLRHINRLLKKLR